MEFITPKAIHIAATSVLDAGLSKYLAAVGVPDWATDAPTDAEKLIEVAGRMCYRSFAPGLNPNVTKTRNGNAPYIANVELQKHGSLLEHAYDTYVLFDVSRILTHQQVRHRAGFSYAQESGHYVRVEGIKMWFPSYFAGHPKAALLKAKFVEVCEYLEQTQVWLAAELNLDNLPFEEKKRATTSMRRLVPDGIATAIVVSANHRAWRWALQLRTARSNDDEIRLVMADVYRQQAAMYPNLYADAHVELFNGIEEVTFGNEKI
jgi:thymidylate synthase (FAD)